MDLGAPQLRDEFKLQNVRGPQLRLPPHRESCSHSELAYYHKHFSGQPTTVDLFCGAGGLSLGLQRAGFRLLLGVDHSPFASETHRAYFPGVSMQKDLADEDVLDEILEPLRGRRVDLLAGGPPCQPFSLASRWIRSVASEGAGSPRDHRRDLWRSFIYAVEMLKPRAILIENVTEIATNEDGIVLRGIISNLERLGYSTQCRAYFAFDLSVPQYRQRLYIVGFHKCARKLDWPHPIAEQARPTLRDGISDLPPLDGGWDEVTPEYRGPITAFQKRLRHGFADSDLTLFDHITRAVRKDDLVAFGLLTPKTRYHELPEDLRRYGAESFTDKYNRLAWDEPCRGITAHMGKDGYWYIHPDQQRSLSIREAARVQSFPDWFRFAGFRTSAFRQIGEAVAPMVAESLGEKIIQHLGSAESTRRSKSIQLDKHTLVRRALGSWYQKTAKKNSLYPWRLEVSLWLNLLGETLFEGRRRRESVTLFWDNYQRDWPTPQHLLRDKHRESHLRTIGLSKKLPALDKLARYLASSTIPRVAEIAQIIGSERLARRAMSISGYSHERPNDPALIRVANRVLNHKGHRERRTVVESQIATAILVGEDEGALIYSAAIELGETICSNSKPACLLCPIAKLCAYSKGRTE